jgi:hypothetical protein
MQIGAVLGAYLVGKPAPSSPREMLATERAVMALK